MITITLPQHFVAEIQIIKCGTEEKFPQTESVGVMLMSFTVFYVSIFGGSIANCQVERLCPLAIFLRREK